MGSSIRGWRAYLLGGAIAMLLAIAPAWGQAPTSLPSPTRATLTPVISIGATATPGFTTDKVSLDGRELFTIAAPIVREQSSQPVSALPLRERVTAIEKTLNALAESNLDPKTLKVKSEVEPKSGLPVISANDRYVMTVTTLDAQLQGQEPTRQADDFVRAIETALQEARKERQPESLIRQCWTAAAILLGMLLASWVTAQVQRRFSRRHTPSHQPATQPAVLTQTPTLLEAPNTLQPDSTIAIAQVQTQISNRQQRNLSDTRRRLLQLLQLLIWVGGAYALVGLFPYTRWLQLLAFSGPLRILGIALTVYSVIRVSNVLLDRFFSTRMVAEFVSPESSQRVALRISTFSWVLRSVVSIVCLGAGFLGVLSAIGVDLVPILAGAGIFGLVISFASQSLIKDMINGLLILYEDQYAVGDMIQVGKATGLVEYMNLRITQLRNAEGRLITIPNSAITVVENLSKDWSRVDLTLTIAYTADVDAALSLIQQLGHAMSQENEWQSKIAEPPTVLGVEDLNSTGVTVRIWIKTVPLEQWKVAREFRRRLKLALDQHGIEIGGVAPIVPPNLGEEAKPKEDKPLASEGRSSA